MKHLSRIAIGSLLSLGACTGGAQNTGVAVSQDAAALTQITLPAATVTQMVQACTAAAPALNTATSATNVPVLSQTAVYPAAYCAALLNSGSLPATTTSTTPSWLAKTLSVTQDLATAAGVILPVVLKALPLVALF